MKKKIAIVLCTILLFVMGTLSVFADPNPTRPTSSSSSYASKYDYPTTWSMVQAFEAQIKLADPSFAITGSPSTQADCAFPLFITRLDYTDGTVQYLAYVAFSSNPSANVQVSSTPEEWGVAGASVVLNTAPSYVVLYRLYIGSNYAFYSGGTTSKWQASTRTISLINTTSAVEQIVYLYSGVGVGFNEQYTFGSAFLSNGQFDRWIDALYGYNNGVGASPEELESAYDDGYDVGYEDGLANGASAEEIESAYDVGYTDGYIQGNDRGYYDGQRDGSALLDIGSIISAIPTAAKGIVNNVFGFELFGINVAGLLSALLVVGIIAFVVKWLMSR